MTVLQVDLKKLSVGALEGLYMGREPIRFVDEQHRLAELVEWRDALRWRADELGKRWRTRRRQVSNSEDERWR